MNHRKGAKNPVAGLGRFCLMTIVQPLHRTGQVPDIRGNDETDRTRPALGTRVTSESLAQTLLHQGPGRIGRLFRANQALRALVGRRPYFATVTIALGPLPDWAVGWASGVRAPVVPMAY